MKVTGSISSKRVTGRITGKNVTGVISSKHVVGSIVQSGFDWDTYWSTRYPSALILTVDSAYQITLNWTNNGSLSSSDSILIYESTDLGLTYSAIDIESYNTTSYIRSGLTPDTVYYYKIRYTRASTFSAYSNAANATTDTIGTAPVFVSAVVENAQPTKVVLTYNQALNESSTPATTDFTVTDSTISSVLVSGSKVILTLSAAVLYLDSKNVTYTAGANPIKGLVGGINAADLGSTAITNNVAAEAEFNTLIAREATASSTALRRLINLTIKGLKDDGVFALGDCLYVRGVHEAQLACQNWIKNAHNSTLVNSPSFTPKVGFSGANLKYINNNYTPVTQAVNLQQTSATIFFMSSIVSTIAFERLLGAQKTSAQTERIDAINTSSNDRVYLNGDTQYDVNTWQNSKYYAYTRTGNIYRSYIDGVASSNSTIVSTIPLPQYNVYELATNVNGSPASYYTTGNICVSFYGGYLDQTKSVALYNRIKYFFDNVGSTF